MIKMTKRKGPNTLPGGTPESTLQRFDIDSPILTHLKRCCKYSRTSVIRTLDYLSSTTDCSIREF